MYDGEYDETSVYGQRSATSRSIGILHNPLYRGRIVWGRREWRKDPDSDRRERRYRLRDEEEWVMVDVPDMRIVDEALADAVDAEVARRTRPEGGSAIGAANRKRHLLSGLINCGACGSNYTIVGKDYYRCARNRERGTCDNARTVKVSAVEEAALSALQTRLLTPELAEVFVKEFTREVARLASTRDDRDQSIRARLAELDVELANLSRNLLAGVVSTTLANMLAQREQERDALRARLGADPGAGVTILPHPALLRHFEQKVIAIREALNDPTLSGEAAETIRSLIERVTIEVEDGVIAADIEASTASLIDFAQNAENPLRRSVGGCSVAVVAGTRNGLKHTFATARA